MKRKLSIQPATIWFVGSVFLAASIITFFIAGHYHNQTLQVELLLFMIPCSVIAVVTGFTMEFQRRAEARKYTPHLVEIQNVRRERDYKRLEREVMRKCEIDLACGDYDSILKGVETEE